MALWQQAEPPRGFTEVWRRELVSLAALAGLRSGLRTQLTGTPDVVHPEREHWSERLVLITDELASNALRHGSTPAAAALSRSGAEWLIAVSDSAALRRPVPAESRDPGQGGFGLYLVAELSGRHGWCHGDGTKTLWATVRSE